MMLCECPLHIFKTECRTVKLRLLYQSTAVPLSPRQSYIHMLICVKYAQQYLTKHIITDVDFHLGTSYLFLKQHDFLPSLRQE